MNISIYIYVCIYIYLHTHHIFVSVLFARSQLGALKFGKSIHHMIKDCSQLGTILGAALICMYAKCGDINRTFKFFINLANEGRIYVGTF